LDPEIKRVLEAEAQAAAKAKDDAAARSQGKVIAEELQSTFGSVGRSSGSGGTPAPPPAPHGESGTWIFHPACGDVGAYYVWERARGSSSRGASPPPAATPTKSKAQKGWERLLNGVDLGIPLSNKDNIVKALKADDASAWYVSAFLDKHLDKDTKKVRAKAGRYMQAAEWMHAHK